jgi:hypothetical protein
MPASILKDPKFAAIIDRAKSIVMHPAAEWDKVSSETTTVEALYKNYIVFLAAIPAVCGLVGSLAFGYGFGSFVVRPSFMNALGSAVGSYVISLAVVAAIAFIVDFLAPKFEGQSNQVQAFKLATYSMTASWLAGVFSLLPSLGSALGILGLYSFYLFYLGVPKLMKVPQEKAGILTVVVCVSAAVVIVLGSRLMH